MTARSKIEQAEAQVGQGLREAGARKPNRRALRALPTTADTAAAPVEVESTDVDSPSVEDVAVAVAVTEPATETATEPSKPAARTSKPRSGKLPSWHSLATPPATRGTATNQRRLNVPVTAAVTAALNSRDKQLMDEGNRWRINRSDLMNAAIEAFAADPSGWVDRWEANRLNTPTATTSLQGRVGEEQDRTIGRLRFLDDGRVVNTGPVLAVIIAAILDQDA